MRNQKSERGRKYTILLSLLCLRLRGSRREAEQTLRALITRKIVNPIEELKQRVSEGCTLCVRKYNSADGFVRLYRPPNIVRGDADTHAACIKKSKFDLAHPRRLARSQLPLATRRSRHRHPQHHGDDAKPRRHLRALSDPDPCPGSRVPTPWSSR